MTPGSDSARARIVLAAGVRLPQAKAGGAYRGEDAGHLGAAVARELVARANLDPGKIDEVIAGCVGPPHDQANVGRVIALRAGVPEHVPARTVGRNCASGMEAVTSAATLIEAGRGDLYLCVGVEVMSAYPLVYGPGFTRLFERLSRARSLVERLNALASFRPRFLVPRVALMEGLTDPTCGLIMGKTAEILAREFAITREESDRFACESHRRAQAARDAGRFQREIAAHLPLGAPPGAAALAADDGIRDGQTLEGLAKLGPYFEKPDGIVTVGNSCGITDGACALLVTTPERARALGLAPLARIRSWAWAGLDPARMGLGPVYASARALDAAGCDLADMGTIEINEAFAAQVLACRKAFASAQFAREHLNRPSSRGPLGELDPGRTNVNGGAIALGHPVGATGARLLLSTAHQLAVANHELGLATLCIGGGQGGAVVLERVS
jgi:acetyl-CoA C-acetyltransferase/acetyl-CoA acyltransferase